MATFASLGAAMTKKAFPEYHKALLDQVTYSGCARHIKFLETRGSFLYKTGGEVFKLRKPYPVDRTLALREAYAMEACLRGQRWAPGVVLDVVPIISREGGFVLGAPLGKPHRESDSVGEGTAPMHAAEERPAPGCPAESIVDYALRMRQLPEHYWADYLARHGRLAPVSVGRVARFLAEHHQQCAAQAQLQEVGRPERFHDLASEALHEMRQCVGLALTQPTWELIALPLSRFGQEQHRLFLRRIKKGRIVDGHGAFAPQHVFIKGREVYAVSPLGRQAKYRVLDAANDVACFINGLLLLDCPEQAELFRQRYASAARDRDLGEILPAYQVLQAARRGLSLCDWLRQGQLPQPQQQQVQLQAQQCFALAAQQARAMLRPQAASPAAQ
ncbi:MAG TPA: hypothetical protein VL359_18270 [bacterium]|nr:hypothetical protein [bacterium]